MLKKLMFATGGVGLLTVLFVGRDAASYVTTTVGKVHDSVKESVPIEFQLERARKMIVDLDPEIRHNMHLIAKEEIRVKRLQREIEERTARLDKDRRDLERLNADLRSGNATFQYANAHRTYTAQEVKADVVKRFKRYKTNDGTLLNLEKVLRAREQTLDGARRKLEGMLAVQKQLGLDVENLQARMKMVEVAQTTSEFNFDDSHLSRTKELIDYIQTRIDVAEKLVNSETHFYDEIPLDEPETDDISGADLTNEIDEYFGRAQPARDTVAVVID